VTPTVEVKGQDVADSVDPDDLTGNDDDNINNKPEGNDKHEVAPSTAKPAVEDLQLKKALELLKDKPAQRAA
jgi:hypothetical protein